MLKKLLIIGFIAMAFSSCYQDKLVQHESGRLELTVVSSEGDWNHLQEKVAETIERYPDYKINKYYIIKSMLGDAIVISFIKDE